MNNPFHICGMNQCFKLHQTPSELTCINCGESREGLGQKSAPTTLPPSSLRSEQPLTQKHLVKTLEGIICLLIYDPN